MRVSYNKCDHCGKRLDDHCYIFLRGRRAKGARARMNFQNKWTPETIYTITTIGVGKDSTDMHSRCVGWFRDFFDADDAVRRNACDINEYNYYQYAVIEQNTEGLYGWTNSLASWWYHWDEENERYDVCDKPSFAEHIGGWGIG